MNRHLLRECSRRVHAEETIICLGDVAHPGRLARPSAPALACSAIEPQVSDILVLGQTTTAP